MSRSPYDLSQHTPRRRRARDRDRSPYDLSTADDAKQDLEEKVEIERRLRELKDRR